MTYSNKFIDTDLVAVRLAGRLQKNFASSHGFIRGSVKMS